MKKLFTLSLLLFFAFRAYSTHNRAGEITYRQLSELTYQFTIITYTYSPSPADKPELELFWGDDKSDNVPRVEKIRMQNPDINRNTYVFTHTYPGPGEYTISFIDPNRNDKVVNIPNSVETPFYVETTLMLNPFLGYNQSPILLQPPIDAGCVGHPFVHNPGAYDPDGDSLSYTLIYCKGADGQPIPGYFYPKSDKSFSLNSLTGDLIWDSPKAPGEYNVAFLIEEWRFGIKVGSVERDMQIIIDVCNDDPPVIEPIPDICVEAGTPIKFTVTATDKNKDDLTLTATGSPFQSKSNPATFGQPVSGNSIVKSEFSWNTNCSLVRSEPYQVVFKAEDLHQNTKLVDIKSVFIKVIGPSPKNISAKAVGNAIVINWDKSICQEAVGYKVYRRLDKYAGTIQCPCINGVPASTGFTLYKTLDGYDQNTFTDDDNGKGLVPGTNYCYYVTAFYKDGVESCASSQICAVLKKDLPIITNVSVVKTDESNGKIDIAWSKPTELDTIQIKGPYRYLIYYSNDFSGTNYTLVDSLGMNKGLDDTLYSHVNVNSSIPHSYRISFYSLANGIRTLIGKTQEASTIFLSIKPTDNRLNLAWEEHVPWTNKTYTVYKLNKTTLLFDSIGTSNIPQFSDNLLINGVSYCYKIKSTGSYSADGLVNPIVNFSQEKCEIPIDNIPPCPPILAVFPDCKAHQNKLIWNNPNRTCSDDVQKYNIYFTPIIKEKMNLITSMNLATDTLYLYANEASIAGCYLVTSLDSANNESPFSDTICVDNCPNYELPNVFTPNNDGANDLFGPFPYNYIKDIDITIYDRWGLEVFQTKNPDIKWDGKNQSNKKDCSDGVYYYVCDVHEIRLEGIRTRSLKGFVSLIKSTSGKTID